MLERWRNNSEQEPSATLSEYPALPGQAEVLAVAPGLLVASTLYVKNGEDGPPLARIAQPYTTEHEKRDPGSLNVYPGTVATILAVSDGASSVGQALAFHHTHPDLVETHAAIAAQEAVATVGQLIDHSPETFIEPGGLQKKVIETQLKHRFRLLPRLYRTPEFSKKMEQFPTTLSVVSSRVEGLHRVIDVIWAGDSPVVILTPHQVLTTYRASEKSSSIHKISPHSCRLQHAQVVCSLGESVTAVVCTDALLKLNDHDDQFHSLVEFLLTCLDMTHDPRLFSLQMQQLYHHKLNDLAWPDDATVAWAHFPGDAGQAAVTSDRKIFKEGLAEKK